MCMVKNKPKIVMDSTVIVSLLRTDRLAIFSRFAHGRLLITNHVLVEITNCFPDQLKSFEYLVDRGILKQISVSNKDELLVFRDLCKLNTLGIGECAAIAVAVTGNRILAIDGRCASSQARRMQPDLRILSTKNLMDTLLKNNVMDENRLKTALNAPFNTSSDRPPNTGVVESS